MPLTIGQVLENRYRVVQLLGQGGFGAVYRAWDTHLNKAVALKENLDTSPEAQRQFSREAEILSNLSHPNLPRVTDHFSITGLGQYLVMDFVEGEDLQTMLNRVGGPLPEREVLAWIEQVCSALAYLHSQTPPIIHRDIKPANIKITPRYQAVLVDFGISKVYDPQLKTTIGARAVTPGYSPWEQYGQGSTDARSDVYALGATLYTLLTGETPPESIALMGGTAGLVPPRTLNPRVSPQTEAAILHAMTTRPSGRYTGVDELRVALMALPPAPIPVPVRPVPPRPVVSHPKAVLPSAPTPSSRPVMPQPVSSPSRQVTVGLYLLVVLATGIGVGLTYDLVGWPLMTSVRALGLMGALARGLGLSLISFSGPLAYFWIPRVGAGGIGWFGARLLSRLFLGGIRSLEAFFLDPWNYLAPVAFEILLARGRYRGRSAWFSVVTTALTMNIDYFAGFLRYPEFSASWVVWSYVTLGGILGGLLGWAIGTWLRRRFHIA